jgi:hypothetical protein
LADAFEAHADETLALARLAFPAAVEAWDLAEPTEPRGVRIARMWADQLRHARHGVGPDNDEARKILDHCYRNRPCNDCGAPIGSPHEHGCDVERCQYTGIQWIQCGGYDGWWTCDCDDIHACGRAPHDCGSEIWDGVWPGIEEAVEFGWYSMFAPPWVRVGVEWPGATPDLNRINGVECRWDRDAKRWVKR